MAASHAHCIKLCLNQTRFWGYRESRNCIGLCHPYAMAGYVPERPDGPYTPYKPYAMNNPFEPYFQPRSSSSSNEPVPDTRGGGFVMALPHGGRRSFEAAMRYMFPGAPPITDEMGEYEGRVARGEVLRASQVPHVAQMSPNAPANAPPFPPPMPHIAFPLPT